jgi:hypothetical protein
MAAGSNTAKGYWVSAVLALLIVTGAVVAPLPTRAIDPGRHQTQAAAATTAPAIAPGPVDIAGSWNRTAAEEIAEAQLRKKKWKVAGFGTPPYTDKFVAENSLTHASHTATFLTFETTPRNFDCHACQPYLSFFEFDQRPDGWKLADSELGVLQAGGWGDFSAQWVSLHALANSVDGIFVDDGGTNQGVSLMNLHLFAKVNGAFRQILLMQISESVPDRGGWSSTITPVPTPAGLADLKVDRVQSDPRNTLRWANGSEQSRDEVANLNGDIRPHDRFSFNGTRYVRCPSVH